MAKERLLSLPLKAVCGSMPGHTGLGIFELPFADKQKWDIYKLEYVSMFWYAMILIEPYFKKGNDDYLSVNNMKQEITHDLLKRLFSLQM